MKADNVKIVLLHEHPEYLNECATLLNTQWKRSLSARVQSLEKSFKDLPDSILLLEEENGAKKVIGHSRLTKVLEDERGCWIGSVVVAEDKRNKGLGKYLMRKSEEYAKKLNFSTIYLNTQDKQEFYEHLGYSYGEAVSSYNGVLGKNLFNVAIPKQNIPCQVMVTHREETSGNESDTNMGIPLPPPPPKAKESKVFFTAQLNSNLGQYWMKKRL